VARNRRLYGGLIVHIGVVLAAIGITASFAFATESEFTLAQGERATFAGYDLVYEGQRTLRQPQRTVMVADLAAARDGEPLGRLTPSLNLYPGASEPIGTPSIRYGVLRDLYASVTAFDPGGEDATFRFFLNPGVTWLWVGGAVITLGGVLAAWPGRRRTTPVEPPLRQRQLAGAR
jgi:cytochrome c-type biogenesis protein CcmF